MTGQPVDHPGRLEALAETRLLDSLPEESFDRFTRLARSLLGADISLVSLVDRNRQFFKSESGLAEPVRSLRQTDMSHSFCRFVVEGGSPFVVEDARTDPRVRSNPAVADLGIVSYLGMPISSLDGYVLGSMCAINTTPRQWSDADKKNLADLASAVTREIELIAQTSALQHALDHARRHNDLREWELKTIVHDLRTPAAAVSSCLDMLRQANPTMAPDDVELIDLSSESTAQLLRMIEQILEVTRIRSGAVTCDKRPISVSRLLRRTARIVKPQAHDAGVAIQLSQMPELVEIDADEPLVERVLLNLLGNAIKYSPKGGRVEIKATLDPDPDPPLCGIAVMDQGPGVPDEEKKIIFNPFVTGSLKGSGNLTSFGIGLSFCKSTVELHGGEIGVKDAPGGGSQFYCLFPVTDGTVTDAPKARDRAC